MRRRYFTIPVVLLLAYCLLPTLSFTWGFFGHKKINRMAVFTLPPEMITFYKLHIDYLAKHSTDADSRKRAVEGEAEKHYIDLDHYGDKPFEVIPKKWKDAVEKFTEDTLNKYGTVPWHIDLMVLRLTEAFKEKNIDKILHCSANLGHYLADAHVPLHTTENYNGQLTGQQGIHSFWESRIPELFAEQWDFFTGRAVYIENINENTWKIVKESFLAKDSVLRFESELSAKWSIDKKYSHTGKKKVYSQEFSEAYNKKLNGMVERRMRSAIHALGSYWYTAWVDAGQPDLNNLLTKEISDTLKVTVKPVDTLNQEIEDAKDHHQE